MKPVIGKGASAVLDPTFQRITDAEKNQWLPYYYAAFANVSAAYMMNMEQMGMADKTDPCVKKMIASLRLIGDPQNRYMTYGPAAEEALTKAKNLTRLIPE